MQIFSLCILVNKYFGNKKNVVYSKNNCQIYFYFIFTECGGMLTSQKGFIISPNFPNKYPNNLHCVWTVHRPYERIDLVFLRFALQQNEVDHVNIYEGPFENSALLLKKAYGMERKYMYKEFADRWIWLEFTTDVAYAENGFQAIWR